MIQVHGDTETINKVFIVNALFDIIISQLFENLTLLIAPSHFHDIVIWLYALSHELSKSSNATHVDKSQYHIHFCSNEKDKGIGK